MVQGSLALGLLGRPALASALSSVASYFLLFLPFLSRETGMSRTMAMMVMVVVVW